MVENEQTEKEEPRRQDWGRDHCVMTGKQEDMSDCK